MVTLLELFCSWSISGTFKVNKCLKLFASSLETFPLGLGFGGGGRQVSVEPLRPRFRPQLWLLFTGYLQAVFKLYLQDGREYLWQSPSKQERDIWAASITAAIRSLDSTAQVTVHALLFSSLCLTCLLPALRSVHSSLSSSWLVIYCFLLTNNI